VPYVNKLDELPAKASIFFQHNAATAIAAADNAETLNGATATAVIQAFTDRISNDGALTPERFKAIMNEVKEATGAKGKDLFHPVRVMLIGSHSGPEFDKLLPLLEQGSALPLPVHVKSVHERVAEFTTQWRR